MCLTTAVMAEYSQTGLLVALFLFTALTLRDIYVGRSSSQSGHQPPDNPDTEPGKPAKAAIYSGPVLRFQYW